MTEAEINWRLRRVYAAFGEKSALKPEDVPAQVWADENSFGMFHDFSGGRSLEQLDTDAASIINEIMGIRDRAKAWFKSRGDDPRKVDDFIRSEMAVALVHDLANTDKHGHLDRPPFSGCRPKLQAITRAATSKYDPATGTYAATSFFKGPSFNFQTGEVSGTPTSSGMEVVLISDIHDEAGNKVGELQKALPDAIYRWENFLVSEGLVLS